MESCLGFYHNNVFVERKMYDHIVIDYPDYLYSHHLGTVSRNGTLLHFYHGFLYSFKAWNRMVNEFYNEISFSCEDGCNGGVCPFVTGVDDECLGECNSNAYGLNGSCERCPMFCRRGCWANGSC